MARAAPPQLQAILFRIQSLVPEDIRARVMSYYTMAFFGAAPFGSLLTGALWFAFELPKVRAGMRPSTRRWVCCLRSA
jgi:hypothetical protein